jgi:predicted Fe-Mo cluster-binding NifX family protein
MKIAISATATDLNSDIDPRFGRCQYFIIVDSDTMEFEAVKNESMMAAGGAGISAAQTIAKKGAQVVLTGNCGPNAHDTLSAAGIQVITGVTGQIKTAIEAYKNGKYEATEQPNVDAHYGSSGRGSNIVSPASQPAPFNEAQELQMLKAEEQLMSKQLADIQHRINELEGK